MMKSKSYRELSDISDYVKRFEYLKIGGTIGELTFNGHRYLNQKFYTSDPQWLKVKQRVILRDDGCDMGHPDFPIFGRIIVHHISPITIDDLIQRNPKIFDPENLICVSHNTHNAIHYGDISLLKLPPVERRANDTCPWR